MSRNVIVIGGVALGPKAASRLKRLDPTANVTMIDENINISFGGCGIPYYVSGELNSLDALRSTTYGTVRTPEYFEHKGVHTLNQTRVTAIDRAAKTVTAKNLVTGEEKALPYDRLIIATGSTPKVPPVEGRDLKNVGGANNLEDADALRKACASGSVQNAVVIGAGFIGMEIAVALADMWDIKTSVVEFMPQAMPGVMSASLSDMVRHDLEEHNVDVYTGEKVQRLEGENGVVARVVTDKRTLDADLVIFATGFAPNTALARAAGLDLEERTGAILVNEYMQTSDPDIYAGGDCVAIPNLITGKPFVLALGSLANRQGRVIGTNAASDNGKAAAFHGAVANVADNILSGQLKPISSKEFGELWKDRANNNVFFADARPAVAGNATAAKYPGEWHAIALEDIEAKFDSIPKDRPVALVCNTGLRSYEVMLYLHNHGVTDVVNALGGMQALIKRGDNM